MACGRSKGDGTSLPTQESIVIHPGCLFATKACAFASSKGREGTLQPGQEIIVVMKKVMKMGQAPRRIAG
jgi:hypothetical protein